MSNAQTRAAIATAISTVPGLRGHTRQPSPCRAGDGWPLWGGGVRDDESMGFEETWRVMVVCDQGDSNAADLFLDTHGDDLLAALRPVMSVDSYAPAVLATEAGNLFALLIIGRSE
jgi:hypothetical protein